jgi:hypothetical protein
VYRLVPGQGRLRLEGIIPGLKIGLHASKDGIHFSTLNVELTLKADEVKDLGDILLKPTE